MPGRWAGGAPDCPETVSHGVGMIEGGRHSNVTLACDDDRQLQTPFILRIYAAQCCITARKDRRRLTKKVQGVV